MKRSGRWRATPKSIFLVATTENRDLHLSVLSLFADRDLTDPALTLEDILRALPAQAPDLDASEATLRRSLERLRDWGLLDETRNESAVYRTPEEFQQRNLQWALTDHGQTAMAAFDAAADFLASVASLQPAAIDALAQSIARVVELVSRPGSESAAIYVEWQQIELQHQALVDNVRQFQRQLAQLLRDPTLDEGVAAQARDAIIEYLTRYIRDAELPAARATEALEKLHALGDELVLARALEGANLAPDPIHGDPAPAWLDKRRRRLLGLDEWFLRSAEGGAAQMARLRSQGRDWVLEFLRVLGLRRAHRRRSAGIIDDFTALARAFAVCVDDDQAHRLFTAAFELHGARHHSLAHEGLEPPDPSTLAASNPPVELSSTLRPRTTTRRRSEERPVEDLCTERARAEAEQIRRVEEQMRIREAVLSDGTVRLSSYGRLDYEEFRELINLVCAALTVLPLPDGRRQAFSSDGRVEVVVHPPDTEDTCELITDRGRLVAPDLRVSLRKRDRR